MGDFLLNSDSNDQFTWQKSPLTQSRQESQDHTERVNLRELIELKEQHTKEKQWMVPRMWYELLETEVESLRTAILNSEMEQMETPKDEDIIQCTKCDELFQSHQVLKEEHLILMESYQGELKIKEKKIKDEIKNEIMSKELAQNKQKNHDLEIKLVQKEQEIQNLLETKQNLQNQLQEQKQNFTKLLNEKIDIIIELEQQKSNLIEQSQYLNLPEISNQEDTNMSKEQIDIKMSAFDTMIEKYENIIQEKNILIDNLELENAEQSFTETNIDVTRIDEIDKLNEIIKWHQQQSKKMKQVNLHGEDAKAKEIDKLNEQIKWFREQSQKMKHVNIQGKEAKGQEIKRLMSIMKEQDSDVKDLMNQFIAKERHAQDLQNQIKEMESQMVFEISFNRKALIAKTKEIESLKKQLSDVGAVNTHT